MDSISSPGATIYLNDQDAAKFMKYDIDQKLSLKLSVRLLMKRHRPSTEATGSNVQVELELLEIQDIESDLEHRLEGKEF